MKKHSQDKVHKCQHCSRKFYRHDMCFEHQKVCDFEEVAEHSVKRKFPEEDENDGLPNKQGTRVVHSGLVSEPHFRSLCMTTVNLHEIDE